MHGVVFALAQTGRISFVRLYALHYGELLDAHLIYANTESGMLFSPEDQNLPASSGDRSYTFRVELTE